MKKLSAFIAACLVAFSIGIFPARAGEGMSFGTKSEVEHAPAVTAVRSFLNFWLLEHNISRAASFIAIADGQVLGQTLRTYKITREQLPDWSRKLLVLLLEDRDDVIPHAMDEAVATNPAYSKLPTDASRAGSKIPTGTLGEVINLKESNMFIFGESVIFSFQFLHTKQGHVSVVFSKVGEEWKVTNLLLSRPN